MHSGLRSAAMKGPTTPPRRPAVISPAAARCAGVICSGGIAGIRSADVLTRSVSHEHVACLREGELQRFAGQAGDKRADGPAEPERDVARQRDRLAFEVHAAVALVEPPVRIEAPQIPAAFADRL